jgi:protein phosphatase-4 regulatory subunit 3
VESDLGVKNQLADAIKILLDPQIPLQDPLGRAGPDYFKVRTNNLLSDAFVQQHFDESSKRLFQPLKQLANRAARKWPVRIFKDLFEDSFANTAPVNDLTFQEVTLYSHLVDILTFFVRQHLFRTRNSIQSESLAPRVAQLLVVPQKHLKLGECVCALFWRVIAYHNRSRPQILPHLDQSPRYLLPSAHDT